MTRYPPQASPQETQIQSRNKPVRQRNTTLFWTLVTLFTLLLCSLIVLALAATGGQLPDLSSGPSWTPPAPPSMGPDQPPEIAPGAFAPGDRVTNVGGSAVNLRKTPGYQGKPGSDVITVIAADASGLVVDGPVSADGLTWWRVQFAQEEGWMAERTNSGVLLLALAP